MSLQQELEGLRADVIPALEVVRVPAFLLDRDGVIRWINPAAERLLGDVRGRRYTDVIAPRDSVTARANFARKVLGERVTDYRVHGIDPGGNEVPLEISSVALRHGHQLVGVFGLIQTPDEPRQTTRQLYRELTPRQHEVLLHLGEGCSTADISRLLGISQETVRNHIRGILRAFGVHTRLQAVLAAHEAGLLV